MPTKKVTNYQTDKWLPSEIKDSDAQKLFSNQWWSERKCQDSTKSLINQFWNVTLISEKTFTTISLWAVEQLCSQVSQKDSVNRLLLWLHQPWKSKSLLHKKENSWFGSEDQFCHLCRLSKLCGSQKPNINKPVQQLCTENVSDDGLSNAFIDTCCI